jgi:hypothetical protein
MLVEAARIPGESNDDPFAARGRRGRAVAYLHEPISWPSQLRPAMTPPSTSTMAPVIQLAFSESRNGNHVRDVFGGADPAKRMHTGKSVLGQVEFLFRELAEV